MTSIDVSGWDTSSVTDMNDVFWVCSGLTSPPDVSGWDTSLVTSMVEAFRGCSNMGSWPRVDLWNIESLTSATSMFFTAVADNARYQATLIAWEAQTEKTSVAFHAGGSKYETGGASETARNVLTGTSSWTITDGGGV